MVEDVTARDIRWPEVLSGLVDGHDLSREMAQHVVAAMLAGQATDSQIAGFLIGLAAKAKPRVRFWVCVMLCSPRQRPSILPEGAIDIVGVGGAPRRRVAAFNVSTIASMVAAAAGATVCKHGNRKASSTSGSFDLLEQLGVNIEASPDVVASGVAKIGLGFAFARAHHPSMRHVGPARAQLGVPSVFNVLGPLAHPGRIKRQVLGVPDAARATQIASVVAGTDAEMVWVVHGHDDLDELSLTGPANVIEVRNGEQRSFVLDPTELGFALVDPSEVKGGDAATNKVLAERVFAGEPSANRDMVVLNAAAGLVVGGVVEDISQGVAAARSAIDDGHAASKLDDLVRHTNL